VARNEFMPGGREDTRRSDDTAVATVGSAATAANPLASGGPAAAAASAATGPIDSPAATLAEARIAVPLDSPGFGSALGTQVTLFAREGVQSARLQLNPAEMGPITVQIALDGASARVDFQADRAATRDALEASLPALAGALQDAGLTLAGGGVFQQSPGQQAPQDPRTPGRAAAMADPGRTVERATAPAAPLRARSRGLVDLVA
jgi:flagellar hook-length control protein FliK